LKILVTGGAGFIGSHVADAYINAGHLVTIIDDLSTGRKENVNPKAKFIQLDLRSEMLRGVFREEKFDIVNHLAAQMDIRKSVEDPIYDASINIIGSVNLLGKCQEYGVRKFIFSSTGGAVYGEQDYFPADEQHPNRPLSPYGISKLTIEKYLYYYHVVYGLPYVALRYANVYGPRQNPRGEAGVIAIFTTKMLAGELPVINGDGKQTRDYVFVDDVVNANVRALQHDKTDIFNIGTGIETTVNEVFKLLNESTGAHCNEQHGPAKKGEQQRSVLETAKARKELGWAPQVNLNRGLERTVEFFRTNKIS
jgi:UDP-glucose 4-epimerase